VQKRNPNSYTIINLEKMRTSFSQRAEAVGVVMPRHLAEWYFKTILFIIAESTKAFETIFSFCHLLNWDPPSRLFWLLVEKIGNAQKENALIVQIRGGRGKRPIKRQSTGGSI
jgi:hypothetical protein